MTPLLFMLDHELVYVATHWELVRQKPLDVPFSQIIYYNPASFARRIASALSATCNLLKIFVM